MERMTGMESRQMAVVESKLLRIGSNVAFLMASFCAGGAVKSHDGIEQAGATVQSLIALAFGLKARSVANSVRKEAGILIP